MELTHNAMSDLVTVLKWVVFDLLILQETGIDKLGDFKGCSFNQTPLPTAHPGGSDHREGQVLGFEGLS